MYFSDIDWTVCNFVFDCNLTQHVSDPTHVKGNLLDLVLTSPSISVNHLIVHPLSVVNFSDHHAISLWFVVMSHLQLYHLHLVMLLIIVMQIMIAFLLTYSNLILVLYMTVVILNLSGFVSSHLFIMPCCCICQRS